MPIRWLILIFCLSSILDATAQSKLEVEVYPLGLSDFETAERIANQIVSSEGKLVADKKGNRLILLDYPEKREALRQALTKVLPASCNVRIQVSFLEDNTIDASSLGFQGGGEIGPGVVNPGEGSHFEIKAQESGANTLSFLEQELIVMSGGKAHLRVGTNLPYADWIYSYGVDHGFWAGAIRWKEVGAQMIVEPYVLDNKQIRIRLTPELSYVVDSRTMTTAIEKLSTEIIVSSGDVIDLGGIPAANKEFYSKFLVGFNRLGEKRSLQIKLKPTVEELVSH